MVLKYNSCGSLKFLSGHQNQTFRNLSQEYDFEELERTTTYKGFTPKSRAIKNFWSVVHKMTAEEKRALLQFFTGSDRVPLGGLSELKLVSAVYEGIEMIVCLWFWCEQLH